MMYTDIDQLNRDLVKCTLCPRIVEFRRSVAGRNPRYRGEVYWSKPVTGFGSIDAKIVIVGLAPAPHGGNRTGRVFTGDYTAENLMKALYEVGLANQPYSRYRGDGLKLCGVYLTAVLKCSPPDNKPLASEIRNCFKYILSEVALLRDARAFIALGRIAWDNLIKVFQNLYNGDIDLDSTDFKHGKVLRIGDDANPIYLVASYHPSPRNMWTGRLTHEMLVEVFSKAIKLARFKPTCFKGSRGS